MDIISNTLKPVIETWGDPGDYPSGAGGGPLPDRRYVSAVTGGLVVEIDDDDVKFLSDEDTNALEYITEALEHETLDHGIGGLKCPQWKINTSSDSGRRITLELAGFESVDTPDDDEPDYDGGDDA